MTNCMASATRTGRFLARLYDLKSRGFSFGACCRLTDGLDALLWDSTWFQYRLWSTHTPFQVPVRMKMLEQKALLLLLEFLQGVRTWQSI